MHLYLCVCVCVLNMRKKIIVFHTGTVRNFISYVCGCACVLLFLAITCAHEMDCNKNRLRMMLRKVFINISIYGNFARAEKTRREGYQC